MIEAREETMVSPLTGENPLRRIGFFIKPCSTVEELTPPRFTSFHRTTTTPSKLPLQVRYNGWFNPHQEWKTWVQKMQKKYEPLWIKAGIHQAIQASTHQIHKNDELILELGQKWCSRTNTFIFPWGEATITLEDMKVCGGFPIVGASVSTPLETYEEREIEDELLASRRIFNSTKARKVSHKPWMMHFMNKESKLEHEAFLVLWLSRFVFPSNSRETIPKSVYSLAVHLARGTRVALAPAVLASIYRDLSLLNNKIRSVATIELGVALWAPFQLVQVWALERFPKLHNQPHFPHHDDAIGHGQPMSAKWNEVNMLKGGNLKMILDSLGAEKDDFLWCPYENSPPRKLYNKNDMWVCDNPNLDIEEQSFARCLMVSELAGIDCIEHYCPNRVAMQFGMDQDIPGMFAHYNVNPWVSYSQSVMDMNFYTALSSCHQPSVTLRYYHWWNQLIDSKPCKEEEVYDHCLVSRTEHLLPTTFSSVKVEGECERFYGPPPGFKPKFERHQAEDSDKEGELSIVKLSSFCNEVRCPDDEGVANGKILSSPQFDVFPSSSVDGAKNLKANENGVKTENSYSNRVAVNDMEGEDSSPCTEDVVSNLESRIGKLERVIAKLKAAKKVQKV
ncbi:hypothetical protein RJT34_00424 [Clitoria ternatea]|uniref:Aminotransferase-like plant mobile domain-containing protein n=1 Tax=Clitoria ternatea TaxID=43366 RepID=A0AAN9Q019_CLITE